MKEIIKEEVYKVREKLFEINDFIYANPELGNNEYKAVETLTTFLKENKFEVQLGIDEIETAFKASYYSGIEGPSIALLCEYDALPGIGHGCGHNMIGTMSVGAAVALSKVINKTGGKIIVFGTPAEETDGAKVKLAERGCFEGIDAAMILHPGELTYKSGTSLAMDAIQFDFYGKTAHAAASPEKGVNALDAVILTFNGINALRQHVTSDVRIHGIISDGGKAANIVPDKATAQFYVRAAKKSYLKEVREKVCNVARGAALMTGAKLEISNYEISYDDMNTNNALSEAFNSNLKLVGIEDIKTPEGGHGSIDMGNVSYVAPAIHPTIGIGNPNLIGHTKDMADFTITKAAHEALLKGACALALTGYDVITDKELLKSIKKEFEVNTRVE
ncbi:M20 family metallopeptidase [Clostridium manihotivorum]|uniref:Peptidase M20 domain-containing protein 2 n=1 Tax=Clostridium manihotivorum TaxID=2320868 RepID=A0A410E0L3_9CLOT|nr:M20 family metallopeptidase [Clostridium manihotivorum]QAA34880.1 amidohydrolase [Clostridium manihotivorum]